MMLIIIINLNTMFNIKNKKRGFTLIELLIVIAIIGVLAATVVVSLGDQTSTAKKETTKIGVSSVRSLATAEVASPKGGTALGGTKLCENILENVSAKDKGKWTWKWDRTNPNAPVFKTCDKRFALTTATGTDGQEGEICCHSSGTSWIIWGALADSDGRGTANTGNNAKLGKDVYCADSSGFLGEVEILPLAAGVDDKASIHRHTTGGDQTVSKCKD